MNRPHGLLAAFVFGVASWLTVTSSAQAQFGGAPGTIVNSKPKPAKPVVGGKPVTIHVAVEPVIEDPKPAPAPAPLTKAELTKKLGEYGLEVTALNEGDKTRLVASAPRTATASLTFYWPTMVTTAGGDGWASFMTTPPGTAVVNINATPGARYLVDITVGDIGTGTGMRKYELTIRPDAKTKDTQVEELNVSKNGEHLLAIVDAKGQFVSVTVKAYKPGSTDRDNFVFHSAEISRLQ